MSDEVVALESSKDVYTVYMDIVGGISKPIPISEDCDPPDYAFPNTFIGFNELKAAFPGREIKVIGTPKETSTKVANGPSEEELQSYMKSLGGPVPPQSKGIIEQAFEYRPQSADVDVLLLTFKQYYKDYTKSTRQNKEIAKAYCNGMAKAIKMVYPSCESKLKAIVDGREEEQDLI